MKTPKSKSVNYLQGFWLKLVSDIIKSAPHGLTKITALKGRFSFPRRVKIEWVIIAFLLALLLGGARARVIPEPIKLPSTHKLMKTLPLPAVEPAQATLEPIPVPEPAPPPQPVYTAPVGVTNCGSDPNLAYIYMHESGCRTDAIGPNGPCGLGQALPCSKLPCSLSDWSCENSWFTNYAISVYGSTYNAMLFWESHSWW